MYINASSNRKEHSFKTQGPEENLPKPFAFYTIVISNLLIFLFYKKYKLIYWKKRKIFALFKPATLDQRSMLKVFEGVVEPARSETDI